MSKSVKVALAGISGYGQSYVDALLANKAGAEFELVATVDPYPQRSRSIETLRARNLPIYPTMLGLFGAHPDLDLVMLSTCMRGQTGPERSYGGFGNQGASLAGLIAITGWPDRPPTPAS